MKRILFILGLTSSTVFSQNYTSYFSGNATDVVTNAKGGICLMGGATEHDEAMKWFLQQANGGDVLVLRATGSNGYNDYLLNQLGIPINSVETIVCNNAAASQEAYIHDKINKAEAIWFAGGDQWTYITYWRNTAIDSLVNKAIAERNVPVGGTSAGMAIQGKYYFSAQNGTVTSAQALTNPYNSLMTVSNLPFIENNYLQNVITDTHYDNPDRKGRQVTFLAKIVADYHEIGKGIACEEYTAVCIDTNGLCKIYGDYPNYDEDIYFIQPNCELPDVTPETCMASTPLTWNLGGVALKVYHAKGTPFGTQTFDLTDWTTGTGGVWEHWYVENGVLTQTAGNAPGCGAANVAMLMQENIQVYPNPAISEFIVIDGINADQFLGVYDSNGRLLKVDFKEGKVNVSELTKGVYFIHILKNTGFESIKFIR